MPWLPKIISSIQSKLASELNTLCNLVDNNIKSNVNHLKKTTILKEGWRTLSQAIELQSTIDARLTALKNCPPVPPLTSGLPLLPRASLVLTQMEILNLMLPASIRSAKQDDIYGASNIVLPCPGS
jgi:hypothetical protein